MHKEFSTAIHIAVSVGYTWKSLEFYFTVWRCQNQPWANRAWQSLLERLKPWPFWRYLMPANHVDTLFDEVVSCWLYHVASWDEWDGRAAGALEETSLLVKLTSLCWNSPHKRSPLTHHPTSCRIIWESLGVLPQTSVQLQKSRRWRLGLHTVVM
jgi:hypothetical protein